MMVNNINNVNNHLSPQATTYTGYISFYTINKQYMGQTISRDNNGCYVCCKIITAEGNMCPVWHTGSH